MVYSPGANGIGGQSQHRLCHGSDQNEHADLHHVRAAVVSRAGHDMNCAVLLFDQRRSHSGTQAKKTHQKTKQNPLAVHDGILGLWNPLQAKKDMKKPTGATRHA